MDNLREGASSSQYDKALVDIISMVKHAAETRSRCLTAEERVERAFDRLTADETFTPEQQQWLERIREHLVANLSIDEDDFDNMPVLQPAGGWGNANRAFEGKLPSLAQRFNEAIAA